MSDVGLVTYERKDHIGVITLNRADSLNAISGALARELTHVCESAARDQEAWVVMLGAVGEKAFCVGADLKERASFTQDDFYANREDMRAMFASVRSLPQPSIAAVFGFALGGGFELALSCDLIVAAEGTKLGLPELRVGLLPAGGGTQLLARRIGLARAKELIYTAQRFSAEHAHDIGVVNRVVPRLELDDAAFSLAEDICKGSPVAARQAKKALDAAIGHPVEQGMEIENDAWREVTTSADRTEGIAAFNEKREPRWSNR
ncbi:MAG: enoyl-CoA hydratase-related protein [Actinomycetota bacterium]|nr:enoyl-CoA hydratase-related protein [Actinomycetota bacterium]